ncbi:Ger(x)C family spore germination C-terminal domain-containing protein [Bacillus sp. 165]|uniref:Ger(x)C family spore germination C-terminal domain-containing protein n=1 Tax=Bacillus sp. 165 TaxID=1529117 RepID=UPI0032AF30DD
MKSFDEETNEPIIYEIESMTSHIQPHVDGNKISFDVDIQSEGRIAEYWVASESPNKNTVLKREEAAAEKEVKRLVEGVLQRT